MLFAKPRPWLQRALGWLGVINVVGSLGDRGVRESFRQPNSDRTPLNAAATALAALAAVMVIGGLVRRS